MKQIKGCHFASALKFTQPSLAVLRDREESLIQKKIIIEHNALCIDLIIGQQTTLLQLIL